MLASPSSLDSVDTASGNSIGMPLSTITAVKNGAATGGLKKRSGFCAGGAKGSPVGSSTAMENGSPNWRMRFALSCGIDG